MNWFSLLKNETKIVFYFWKKTVFFFIWVRILVTEVLTLGARFISGSEKKKKKLTAITWNSSYSSMFLQSRRFPLSSVLSLCSLCLCLSASIASQSLIFGLKKYTPRWALLFFLLYKPVPLGGFFTSPDLPLQGKVCALCILLLFLSMMGFSHLFL